MKIVAGALGAVAVTVALLPNSTSYEIGIFYLLGALVVGGALGFGWSRL